MRRYFYFFFFIGFVLNACAQKNPLDTKDDKAQQVWVDVAYDLMTIEERIGQLFMVSIQSNQKQSKIEELKTLIENEHIGGVIFLRGNATDQARLTNNFQEVSKTPLLIGSDAEWGLAMRLEDTFAFPWNMTLGAINDAETVEKVGKQIGEHCKRLGIHINFAPVLDINTNPKNPIIGNRSFGEDRENVTQKAMAFMKGLQKSNILACAKHFPGHGDTATDSHKALPFLDFDRKRLDSIELYPYKKIISKGIEAVMVAHLDVPCLESKDGYPSSLSESIITDLLKEELKFEGLVFSDALNMKAVSDFVEEGEVELQAFLAGNDMLLMPVNVMAAKQKLLDAYNNGIFNEARLEYSVKKILKAKYKAGLNNYKPTKLEGLEADLHTVKDKIVYEEAMEKAITVIKNDFTLLPIKNLENKKIAYVGIGDDSGKEFHHALNNYTNVTAINADNIDTYKEQLAKYNLVIVGFHKSNASPWKNYKFLKKDLDVLQAVADLRTSNTILALFTKPYALSHLQSFQNIDGIAIGYQNSKIGQQKMAEALFGANEVTGKLPVSINKDFKVNTGIQLKNLRRLGYSIPERVGMNAAKLAYVDTLVKHGIDSLMFPGAQVLIARKGKVIYNKSFGKPTYTTLDSITNDHIYDLASLTKILATLPVIMKMEEEGSIKLNNTFEELVPDFADTEIKDVTVLKSLSHYGRLPAWVAFYLRTLDKNGRPSGEYYRNKPVGEFSIKVFDDLYLTEAYTDSIYSRIGDLELKSNRYRYSDVTYYVMKKFIEETYHKRLDAITDSFLYQSLGTSNTTFNPIDKYPKELIVPTEEDNYYRHNVVQGYVHDMGAAMQGGVGGHAGLFSNANDVAKIMQMYLQGGYYGGKRYLNYRTIKKFNTCYFCNEDVRRGVGFDKPQLKTHGPTCGCVSRKSFGHSGFTGTYTWADPEEEIVYVFLSNRTFPSARNNLLIKSELRTRIQQVIYDSVIN